MVVLDTSCASRNVATNPPADPLVKRDAVAIFLFLGVLALFYPDLLLGERASLTGDHWEQHYPWAKLLWDSVRRFELPFWTPLMQCGFPIAAESQIGVFYPVNLMLCLLLPLPFAYAYANLLHFAISGIATYLYGRQMHLNPIGALMAAFLFVFGTSYAL